MIKSEDGPIERIRSVRHQISEECGHDTERLVAYYIELQKSHAGRLIYRAADEYEASAETQEQPKQTATTTG